MTTKQNSFARSDLNEELRLLLGAERGIQDAENLRPRLPLLSEHPAVVAQSPKIRGRAFQRGLERALGKAIELSGESEDMQAAIRWHLALDHADVIQDPTDREQSALKIAGSKNLNKYSKDRPAGQQRPDLTVALESVETQLEILGRASLGRPRVKVGGVEIPDIRPLATCAQGRDATHEMTLEFEQALREPRPDCEEWPLLRALLPELKDEAKAHGRKFFNGEMLDLVHAEDPEPDSGGSHRYRLGVAKTDYNRWAATANSLDRDLGRRELTELLGSSTLRQAWGHAPDCLEDLAELPAPCFMGVCVVVVADNKIVVLARQRKHYVAGSELSSADRSHKATPVHFVGEGVEPKDFIPGRNPFERAALRGCWEELELAAKDIDLIPTAFVFDTLRWQPLFCYLARCKLGISELEVLMQKAKDDDETGRRIAALVPPTITATETRALLTGSDPSMRLASNHAEIALLYALAYTDGLELVASETL